MVENLVIRHFASPIHVGNNWGKKEIYVGDIRIIYTQSTQSPGVCLLDFLSTSGFRNGTSVK